MAVTILKVKHDNHGFYASKEPENVPPTSHFFLSKDHQWVKVSEYRSSLHAEVTSFKSKREVIMHLKQLFPAIKKIIRQGDAEVMFKLEES